MRRAWRHGSSGVRARAMGEPAYWPWLQIIRQRVRSCELPQLIEEMGPGVADIAPLIDEVRDRLPNAPVRPATLESEQARFRLFDSIATFLKNVALSPAGSARPRRSPLGGRGVAAAASVSVERAA